MGDPVGLWIDWDDDGFGTGAYDDCTALLTKATYTRGGSPEVTGAAQAGSAVFTLKNPNGLFDPDNASSPLYGKLRDGLKVWFGVNRSDGTIDYVGGAVRGRFAGRTTEIAPLPVAGAGDSTPLAEIVCEDPLGWYARTPVQLDADCSPPAPPAPKKYLVAIVGFDGTDPIDISTHPWTLVGMVSFANGSQFPGPGGGRMALYIRAVVPGESATVMSLAGAGSPTDGTGCWVYEVDGIDDATVTGFISSDTLNPALNAVSDVVATGSAGSAMIGFFGLQKVDYGQYANKAITAGTQLFCGNSQNTPDIPYSDPSWSGTTDPRPPSVLIGYQTGGGTMHVTATVTHTGAIPDYNLMGRGYGYVLFNVLTSFSITQSAFGGTTLAGGPFNVTLPSPP